MKNAVFVVVLIVVAVVGAWSYTQLTSATPPELESARIYDQPRVVPPFLLEGSDGAEVRNEALEGQWTLIFTGYTFCPDICPTTMANLKSRWDDLEAATDTPVEVWMVSVDPQRDDVERLANYVGFFGDGFYGVRAEHTELHPFVRSLGMMYSVPAPDEENYLVDHSASIVLINPRGEQHAIFQSSHELGELAVVRPATLIPDFQKIVRYLERVL